MNVGSWCKWVWKCFTVYTRSEQDSKSGSGCISDFLGVQKWVTKYAFVMVCDVKWGFGRSDKKVEIS